MIIDITSDIEAALKDVDDFFWTQVPFSIAMALNDTAFDVRKRVVGSTYRNAFEVRNPVTAGASWKVDRVALRASGFSDFKYGGGVIEAIVRQKELKGRSGTRMLDYFERHITGGTKRPTKHQGVAVPVAAAGGRMVRGGIKKAFKPTTLRNRKDVFIRKGRGGSRLIMQREKDGGLKMWYVLTPAAKIDRRFRFYEDGVDTVDRVFSGHWSTRMSRIIRNSRFT